jgi:hypothetical protein
VLAVYAPADDGTGHQPFVTNVLTIHNGLLAAVTGFVQPELRRVAGGHRPGAFETIRRTSCPTVPARVSAEQAQAQCSAGQVTQGKPAHPNGGGGLAARDTSRSGWCTRRRGPARAGAAGQRKRPSPRSEGGRPYYACVRARSSDGRDVEGNVE